MKIIKLHLFYLFHFRCDNNKKDKFRFVFSFFSIFIAKVILKVIKLHLLYFYFIRECVRTYVNKRRIKIRYKDSTLKLF